MSEFDPKKHYAKLDNIVEDWTRILDENAQIMDAIRESLRVDDKIGSAV